MDKNGDVLQLNLPGPNNGTLVLVAAYMNKTVTLVEIVPNAPLTTKVQVWEVQSYTAVGR